MSDSAVELVPSRNADGLGFLLKVPASGRVYRVAPARDPRQPRFWCFLVYRCTPGGVADASERPWTGAGGMTREELPAAVAAIRADPVAWLARDECRELRRWLLSTDVTSAAEPDRSQWSDARRSPLPDRAAIAGSASTEHAEVAR